jgi:hypothetical protein
VERFALRRRSVSLRVAPCRSVSLRVAPCRSVSLRVAPCRSVSLRVAPCRSVSTVLPAMNRHRQVYLQCGAVLIFFKKKGLRKISLPLPLSLCTSPTHMVESSWVGFDTRPISIFFGRSPVLHPRVCCPFPTKHRRHTMERDDLTTSPGGDEILGYRNPRPQDGGPPRGRLRGAARSLGQTQA